MKIAILLLLCAGVGAAQTTKPTYTPQMCSVKQPTASKAYIAYCIKNSVEYPACSSGDPREPMWVSQANGGGEVYFEVLDCSWHPGKNPRDSMKLVEQAKPTPKPAPFQICGMDGKNCHTLNASSNITFSAATPPADMSVLNATDAKTGVHTITITDPGNHWRCLVTSTVPVHPGNVLHTEMSAFTMTCFDATELDPVPTKPHSAE
jgi:hypothetical protein